MPLVIKGFVVLIVWTFLLPIGADVMGADLQPIIDVHHHAMDNDNGFSVGPTCPNTSKFTASDLKTGTGQDSGWEKEECTPKLYPAAKGECMKDVLAEMERLNVTAVVFGDPASVKNGKMRPPNVANLLTLLQTNSQVYVDIAGLIWSYPINEVNRYIERIVDAGFEDRVMFGTDQFIWPKLMAYSISIIQNADYLTPEQKRDILYNNAARFLRLDLVKK